MVAASDRDGVVFALSAGNCSDALEGRALLQQLGPVDRPVYLLMDRAYEGDETRTLAVELGYIPVVPPKSNRKSPWDYDKQLYKQRNQVERLFRRIFTRYEKLDVIFQHLSILPLLLTPLYEHCLVKSVNTIGFATDGKLAALEQFSRRTYTDQAEQEQSQLTAWGPCPTAKSLWRSAS